jgi:hypothetical protein
MGTKRAPKRTPKTASASADLSIEETWRYVDRFCRTLWVKHMDDETPSSLANIIITLRDQERLPPHEANMMHTIRSLRNMVVHENPDFSGNETTIARAAWEIVRAWGEKRERAAWRKTAKMCT